MTVVSDWFYSELDTLRNKMQNFVTPTFIAGGRVNAVLVGGGEESQTDEITGALVTIPVVHHEVHEGETFTSSYKSADGAPVADNGTVDLLLQTGAKYAHLVFGVACGGDLEIALYEGTTVSNLGTPLAENNMKRYSAKTATVAVTHSPTVTLVGTLLLNRFVPGGTGPQAVGSTSRENTEWVLKASTIYLIRGINRAGNAQPMSTVAQWYEESDA